MQARDLGVKCTKEIGFDIDVLDKATRERLSSPERRSQPPRRDAPSSGPVSATPRSCADAAVCSVHDAGITPYLLMFVRFQVVTDERYLPSNTAPLYSWGASCT
jgi:hypothetical protein